MSNIVVTKSATHQYNISNGGTLVNVLKKESHIYHKSGETTCDISEYPTEVLGLAISGDGNTVALRSNSYVTIIRCINDMYWVPVIQIFTMGIVTDGNMQMALSETGTRLAIAGYSPEEKSLLRVYGISEYNTAYLYPVDGDLPDKDLFGKGMSFSPCGNFLYVGTPGLNSETSLLRYSIINSCLVLNLEYENMDSNPYNGSVVKYDGQNEAVYTASYFSGEIAVYDVSKDEQLTTFNINIDKSDGNFIIASEIMDLNGLFYVVALDTRTLYTVDPSDGKVRYNYAIFTFEEKEYGSGTWDVKKIGNFPVRDKMPGDKMNKGCMLSCDAEGTISITVNSAWSDDSFTGDVLPESA